MQRIESFAGRIQGLPLSDEKPDKKTGTSKTYPRMKLVVASLLPTLWLVTSGQSLLDPMGPCATGNFCAWVSRSESGEDFPLKQARFFLAAARPISIRIGTHSGTDKIPSLETIFCGWDVEWTPIAISSPTSDGSLALAKSWQFHCRTALEPRAPSPVS